MKRRDFIKNASLALSAAFVPNICLFNQEIVNQKLSS